MADDVAPLDARGKDLTALGRQLREQIPDVYSARAHSHKAAFADGALDRATKELIALAIAVVDHCDGCMATHARGAADAGATKEQVAEMLGVTIHMAGGPGATFSARAYGEFLTHLDGESA
jgi:AhpD family alkylhydroperoxidase